MPSSVIISAVLLILLITGLTISQRVDRTELLLNPIRRLNAHPLLNHTIVLAIYMAVELINTTESIMIGAEIAVEAFALGALGAGFRDLGDELVFLVVLGFDADEVGDDSLLERMRC